jgi:hypothetical protein
VKKSKTAKNAKMASVNGLVGARRTRWKGRVDGFVSPTATGILAGGFFHSP